MSLTLIIIIVVVVAPPPQNVNWSRLMAEYGDKACVCWGGGLRVELRLFFLGVGVGWPGGNVAGSAHGTGRVNPGWRNVCFVEPFNKDQMGSTCGIEKAGPPPWVLSPNPCPSPPHPTHTQTTPQAHPDRTSSPSPSPSAEPKVGVQQVKRPLPLPLQSRMHLLHGSLPGREKVALEGSNSKVKNALPGAL